jgi:hypothetical protein
MFFLISSNNPGIEIEQVVLIDYFSKIFWVQKVDKYRIYRIMGHFGPWTFRTRHFGPGVNLGHFGPDIWTFRTTYLTFRIIHWRLLSNAVLHLEFQNYGRLSPTQLKNVGDLKKMWRIYIYLTVWHTEKKSFILRSGIFDSYRPLKNGSKKNKILTNTTKHTWDDSVGCYMRFSTYFSHTCNHEWKQTWLKRSRYDEDKLN